MLATRMNQLIRPWTRWQDWVALLLGVVLLLTTLWTSTDAAARSVLLVFGALLVLAAAWSLATPSSVTSEYAHMLIGVLVFVAPWALGFTELAGAAWTCWVVGVLAVITGAAALPEANAAHGRHQAD